MVNRSIPSLPLCLSMHPLFNFYERPRLSLHALALCLTHVSAPGSHMPHPVTFPLSPLWLGALLLKWLKIFFIQQNLEIWLDSTKLPKMNILPTPRKGKILIQQEREREREKERERERESDRNRWRTKLCIEVIFRITLLQKSHQEMPMFVR